MWCPRCDQGFVIKARIKANNEIIFLCEECDATWFKKDDVKAKGYLDYGTYMESIGLTELWEEIEVVDERP